MVTHSYSLTMFIMIGIIHHHHSSISLISCDIPPCTVSKNQKKSRIVRTRPPYSIWMLQVFYSSEAKFILLWKKKKRKNWRKTSSYPRSTDNELMVFWTQHFVTKLAFELFITTENYRSYGKRAKVQSELSGKSDYAGPSLC